jgi:1,2-diacylglycerol 3-beta-glucosyltransferase
VPGLLALWKQRQRWAEGGFQRFFDYWPTLTSSQLSVRQRWDLACFFLLQYGLPVVSFADLSTSVLTRTPPTYWPLSIVAFSVSALAYLRGCRGVNQGPADSVPWFVESVGGDYVSRPLVCGDSMGDVENGSSAEAIGLGQNEPRW